MLTFQDLKKNKYLSTLFALFLSLMIYAGKLFVKKVSNKKAAVIVLHKLGDSVFTIPALKLLKKHYGQITIICFPENVPIYRIVFPDDPVVEIGHNEFLLSGRIAKQNARKKITNIKAGTIIDLTGSVISASVLFGISAKEVIGLNENIYKAIYTELIPIRKEPHIVDIYLDVVKKIMPVPKDNILKTFPVEIKKDGYILIHPFAGWAAKEWNIEKFIHLAERLSLKYNVAFVSPSERINHLKLENIKVFETKTVNELIEVIKGSSIVISNDSGPIHIAALLGKSTFTIFGPTNPVFHIPFGDKHKFIQKKIKCSPKPGEKYCYTNAGRSGCPSFECMNMLETNEVLIAVEGFLAELGIESKKHSVSPGN